MDHKIPTRKNLGPTKYPQEKIWDPRNTHKKIFWTVEIPTRKNFGSMKYPREKNSYPWKAQWQGGTRPTRPTIAREPQNLAHPIIHYLILSAQFSLNFLDNSLLYLLHRYFPSLLYLLHRDFLIALLLQWLQNVIRNYFRYRALWKFFFISCLISSHR